MKDPEDARRAQFTVQASPALRAGQWGQLCVSCRLVRPLRAKHCAVNDRCVEVFDHYCPWVGNTIGKKNRHIFCTLLVVTALSLVSRVSSCCSVAVHRVAGDQCACLLSRGATRLGWDADGATTLQPRLRPQLLGALTGALRLREGAGGLRSLAGGFWIILFVAWMCVLLLSTTAIIVAQVQSLLANVTTNEMSNWHRYSHMKHPRRAAGRKRPRLHVGPLRAIGDDTRETQGRAKALRQSHSTFSTFDTLQDWHLLQPL